MLSRIEFANTKDSIASPLQSRVAYKEEPTQEVSFLPPHQRQQGRTNKPTSIHAEKQRPADAAASRKEKCRISCAGNRKKDSTVVLFQTIQALVAFAILQHHLSHLQVSVLPFVISGTRSRESASPRSHPIAASIAVTKTVTALKWRKKERVTVEKSIIAQLADLR